MQHSLKLAFIVLVVFTQLLLTEVDARKKSSKTKKNKDSTPKKALVIEWKKEVNKNEPAQQPCTKFHDASLEDLYKINPNFISVKSSPATSAECNLITYSMQFTMSRSSMLELQAQHWLGPMSVAFYGTADEAKNLTELVLASRILSERTNIAYHHVLRRTEDELYPGNILRNIALKHVNTPYAITVDIDFLPRSGMCKRLQKFLQLKSTKGGVAHPLDKVAYVVPLFSEYLPTRSEFLNQFPTDKTALVRLWKSHTTTQQPVLGIFGGNFTESQGATNFSRWITATKPYEIQYQEPFEPIYLYRLQTVEDAAKSIANLLPQNFTVQTKYFPYFVGYRDFRNFAAMTLTVLGFNMYVLPNEYMIHVYHEKSEARKNQDKFIPCEDESWQKLKQHRRNLCEVQKKTEPEFYKKNSVCQQIAFLECCFTYREFA